MLSCRDSHDSTKIGAEVVVEESCDGLLWWVEGAKKRRSGAFRLPGRGFWAERLKIDGACLLVTVMANVAMTVP